MDPALPGPPTRRREAWEAYWPTSHISPKTYANEFPKWLLHDGFCLMWPKTASAARTLRRCMA